MVMSFLYICLVGDGVQLVESFEIGEVIKVRCHLGYSREDRCIFLIAQGLEMISGVKVVVI